MSTLQVITGSDQLARAVVISLFTWRRAEPSDPIDDQERYGWWADSFPDRAGDRIGSRLWLLRRRTVTAQVLRDARAYALEALKWLKEDEIAQAVDVAVTDRGRGRIDLTVTLVLDDGDRVLQFDDVLRTVDDAI